MNNFIKDSVVPETFYKYFTLGDWFPMLLSGKSMKFTSRADFNDPFDSRPAYKHSNPEKSIEYTKQSLKALGISPTRRIQIEQQLRRKKCVSGLDKFERQANLLLDKVGILCITEEWNNILMWSHYADNHRGVCVGFRSNMDFFQAALKIIYQPHKPIINIPEDLKSREVLYEDTFLKKAECWSSEKEWRILKSPMNEIDRNIEKQYTANMEINPEDARIFYDQRGTGFYSFNNSAIRDITLGAMINSSIEAQVLKWIKDSGVNVRVYKAKLSPFEYGLVRE